MSIRKAGKILLYCLAGLLGVVLLLMLAIKLALDRAPAYQAEIKEWVHAQTGYHIGFARVSPSFRWYGPELHFSELELRSKDGERVLARAGGGRVAADIWQLISSGKLLAGRIELDSPNIVIARLGPTRFALASEIRLGGDDASVTALTLDDLPAGKLAIRHAKVTLQNWNAALPQLALKRTSTWIWRAMSRHDAGPECAHAAGSRRRIERERRCSGPGRFADPWIGMRWFGRATCPSRDGECCCRST